MPATLASRVRLRRPLNGAGGALLAAALFAAEPLASAHPHPPGVIVQHKPDFPPPAPTPGLEALVALAICALLFSPIAITMWVDRRRARTARRR
jgi:hypothetical protein